MGLEGTSGGGLIHPPSAKPAKNFFIPPSYFKIQINFNRRRSLDPSFLPPSIEMQEKMGYLLHSHG